MPPGKSSIKWIDIRDKEQEVASDLRLALYYYIDFHIGSVAGSNRITGMVGHIMQLVNSLLHIITEA